MPLCLLFVSSTSHIVFNPSAGEITDLSQSAKIKSQLCGGPGHPKPLLVLPNVLSKQGEQAHDRNKFVVVWFKTCNLLIDRPVSYR